MKDKNGRKFKTYPTNFECTDDDRELIFKVKLFDEHTAEVEIKSLVSAKDWPEISAHIQECFDNMFVDDE